MLGEGEVQLYAYVFFASLLQTLKKNKESELFRKPKLFIPIFPVQLKAQLLSQGSSWCFDLLFFYSFVQWFIL